MGDLNERYIYIFQEFFIAPRKFLDFDAVDTFKERKSSFKNTSQLVEVIKKLVGIEYSYCENMNTKYHKASAICTCRAG